MILSATYGEGHQAAARALAYALRMEAPHVDAEIVDFFEFVDSRLNSAARWAYVESVRRAPIAYGWFYYATGEIATDSWLQKRLNRLGRKRLLGFLQSHRPDLILCTYPTPAGVLAELRTSGIVVPPVGTVVTDYTVHSQWIHPEVDRYYVGTESVADGLSKRGIQRERVLVTGIPIAPKFSRELDQRALRQRYGIDADAQVVLVMAGGFGMLTGTEAVVRTLASFKLNVHVIVVAGKDPRREEHMRRIAVGSKRPMLVYGYIQEVDELMSIADVLVTKAGGLTVSEALAKTLPMIIYRPVPGQEARNTTFLVDSGAAVVAMTPEQLTLRLEEVLSDSNRREQMVSAAASISCPQAALEIARDVERLLTPAEAEA